MTFLSATSWLGGAPDSGKTTVARILALRHNLALYHYDSADGAHHERLAAHDPVYARFMDATLDERWLDATPAALVERALNSFRDRWPLVLEDIAALEAPAVLVEGFGLLPELVTALDGPPRPSAFLDPSESFKAASFAARNKPSFAHRTSDPERARRNMLDRDRLLARHVARSASDLGLPVVSVDTGSTVDAVVAAVEAALGLSVRPGA